MGGGRAAEAGPAPSDATAPIGREGGRSGSRPVRRNIGQARQTQVSEISVLRWWSNANHSRRAHKQVFGICIMSHHGHATMLKRCASPGGASHNANAGVWARLDCFGSASPGKCPSIQMAGHRTSLVTLQGLPHRPARIPRDKSVTEHSVSLWELFSVRPTPVARPPRGPTVPRPRSLGRRGEAGASRGRQSGNGWQLRSTMTCLNRRRERGGGATGGRRPSERRQTDAPRLAPHLEPLGNAESQ